MSALNHPVCAFIKLDHPVDFDASDGQPVDLLFALLVPENSTEEHLQILSTIAKMFSDRRICSALRECDQRDMPVRSCSASGNVQRMTCMSTTLEIAVLVQGPAGKAGVRVDTGEEHGDQLLHPDGSDATSEISLVGHLNLINPHRVQVLGSKELDYLGFPEKNSRKDAITQLFSGQSDLVIIARGLRAPADLTEAAAGQPDTDAVFPPGQRGDHPEPAVLSRQTTSPRRSPCTACSWRSWAPAS